jgi:hypothetical protein
MQITECAIMGRLWLLERASPEEQDLVLERGRSIAEEVIRGELANARLLSPSAHRMIMHQGRADSLGLRSPKRRRNRLGRMTRPRPYRRMGGEYWLTSQIYYIVDNGRIVAAVPLSHNQLDTIEEFGDQPDNDEPCVSILELVRQSLEEPVSGIRPVAPSSHEPESKPITSRTALTVPRWMQRSDGRWTLLVLDDDETAQASVRRVNKWMRKEFRDLRPEPVFAERSHDVIGDVKEELRKTWHLHTSDIPKLRGMNWRWCGLPVTASALRWWKRMFRHVAPAHGKLVMLVTPNMARKILAIVDDSPRSAWRTNPASVRHGRAFRLVWDTETSRLAITDEDF